MEELKNIVIQTLESNGILGNLRAQLRSSVFKVIDSQDKNLKDGCGFQWENPLAPKIVETAEGMMCIDIIREFLEFYRMDYTLSTFLPECSLSQEPKSRPELEEKLGVTQSNSSMPLLMNLILNFQKGVTSSKAGSPSGPKVNNLVDESSSKKEKPDIDEQLWDSSGNNNKDLKPYMNAEKENTSTQEQAKKPIPEPTSSDKNSLSALGDLPSLSGKKGGLQPLDFNPKEEDKHDDSVEGEKKKLDDIDKKLKEFGSDSMQIEVPKASPEKPKKPAPAKVEDDYEDDFEDDIVEDLPVEDFDVDDHKEKDNLAESGVSASQSMGMDPSVTSLDIEGYDYVEQAVVNSPYKI